ncbi:MAG: membrane protein insertase YidC, partial [Flavobacteriales bacterium]
MDRNTFIGIALIIGILFTFNYINQPSAEEIQAKNERIDRYNDSIQELRDAAKLVELNEQTDSGEVTIDTPEFAALKDSLLDLKLAGKFAEFSSSAKGSDAKYTIENQDLRLTFASKGGVVVKAELLQYQNYTNYMRAKDSLVDIEAKDLPVLEPLVLFDEKSSSMYFDIPMQNSKDLATSELYFTPVKIEGNKIILRAKTNSEDKFIEMKYELLDNYEVDFSLDFVGLEDIVDGKGLNLNWEMKSLLTEKEFEGQSRMSSVFYKPSDDGRTYLSEMAEDSDVLESKTDWIAFKHCYFSSVVMSKEGFEPGGEVFSKPVKEGIYSDEYRATNINLSTKIDNRTSIPLTFFYGPNDYEVLSKHDNEMVDIIDLGWGVFRWTAKWLIKPIFDFFNSFGMAMGLIILLVTIAVRLIILPLTYKNYKSSAKMKVLKPEIEEINEKFKNGDAAEKQKATMALYRKTGVNPLAGCLPLFIQMPILLAVFRFFPSSIEMRQRSFLWAEDLSTYESVYDLGFSIPAYGDHVSLFTILLCISTIFYTRMNSSQMSMPS